MPFLTARWSNLCLLTYAVPPELLAPRLPKGLELDTRDGRAFVSLVAFDFLDTRVLGVPWPGYRDFAELNLRYYARRPGERGVIFLREIVQSRCVAWIARTLYNEPYVTAPLTTRIRETPTSITAERQLVWAGRTHTISVTGGKPCCYAEEGCDTHFFKELQWGYGVDRRGRTIRYEVEHPVWETYPVESYTLDFDWAAVYGREWAFLANEQPMSVIFAVGSAIAVSGKSRLVIEEKRNGGAQL